MLDLRSPEERGQMSLLDGECGGWCEAGTIRHCASSERAFPIPNSGEMRR
jgi:hypothetical protein